MTALTSNPLGATARGPWAGFVLRRTRRLVVSLAALVTAAFAVIHLIPGDPVRAALGPTADPALIEARRHSLGLDESLPKQFGHFVGHLFQGRLGDSIGAQMPVSEIVAGRLPATLQIAVPAFALILLIAVPVGMTAAVLTKDGRRRRGELAFTGITGLLGAVPEFLLAVGLIAAFAVMWPLFRWPPAPAWTPTCCRYWRSPSSRRRPCRASSGWRPCGCSGRTTCGPPADAPARTTGRESETAP
ncbi:ABC transporter permease [Streptomyces sp. NPDC001750]|uniref:ABC transporter permease n=1 Tax=Streptomyces sp. NPDC001750 TaxID=3364607 RepID=UPI00369A7574